ncbi:MAG TPA: ATP-dependent Clp protease adaptor ClpS [Caldilineaceae bacterium]|nr:ATP-dependent Clp protease adaptor ClpS [Caldilineaceae bacterium]
MSEQTPLPAGQPDEEQEILRLMRPALDHLHPAAGRDDAMRYVVIHNNDTAPYEYVVQLLESFFLVSEELADHIAWTAHTKGAAVVAVRPSEEATMLVQVAQGRAKYDGFPLIFTLEPVAA